MKADSMTYDLCTRADKAWNRGQNELAFKLFKAAAHAGDVGAYHNLGYCYDAGRGTRKDRMAALYWYRLAWRKSAKGAGSHTSDNIAMMYEEVENYRTAIAWWTKGTTTGDGESALGLAKLLIKLERRGWRKRAKALLTMAANADPTFMTIDGLEQVKRLLNNIESSSSRRSSKTFRKKPRSRDR